MALETKIVELGERQLVSAVIVDFHKPIPERPDHRFDFYEYLPPGDFKGKRYAQLYSDTALRLFPGEFVLVSGHLEEVLVSSPLPVRYLKIEELVGEKRFVVRVGDLVRMHGPTAGKVSETTYDEWVGVKNIDGQRDVIVHVPILAFGRTVTDWQIEQPLVKVTKIVKPEERANRGYFIYATFEGVDSGGK